MILSRTAQGLYWMGRYLERAEHLCRQIHLQVEALVDRPVREIHLGWKRIYVAIGREPPVGGMEFGEGDDYALADSFTLADHLTFDRSHPDSIWGCLALGRENARQMRHRISPEMWTCLNLCYLRVRDLGLTDIWKISPESFYIDTAREIDTFVGVAEATMYRDEGWHFLRLGQFIERSQLNISLLLAQYAYTRSHTDAQDEDWAILLRIYQALEVYVGAYGVEITPDRVVDFLATDTRLPRSLQRSIAASAAELDAIARESGTQIDRDLRQFKDRLCHRIDRHWPGQEGRESFLREFSADCERLHDLVMTTYIDYDLEAIPAK